MKYIIVGIFDRKAQVFISLEPTPNTAVATRQFGDVINKADGNPMNKWPADFELYELGEWDSESGMVQHITDEGANYLRKLIVSGDALKQN